MRCRGSNSVGAGLLTRFLLITYLLPGTLLFIPLYQILSSSGW